MEKKARVKILIAAVFVFLFLAMTPQFAHAATLYFSPSSGSYAVGTILSVDIYVSSAGQAMNAASGVISFPQDKLEAVSLSKAGSIFTLWVQEPSFLNGAGTVNFEGIVLNPGFTGVSGKLVTVSFRVKAAGTTLLNFSSGSVLANDGQGTNILTNFGDAQFSLGGAAQSGAPEAVTPAELTGTPSAPEISSSTHPDPTKWYPLNTPKFTWALPSDATGVRLLVGRISNAVPTVTYIPAIGSKELDDFEDGIWYFSVRLRNDVGWGAISRFRFQIDVEKPSSFEIYEIRRVDLTEPKAKFIFNASDKTSGISYYEVQIDNESPKIWQDDGSHKYETPVLDPGEHILIAKAVDKAGNALANSAEFDIEALEPPFITEYPKQLPSGEPLLIKGATEYPNARTAVWFERKGEEAKLQIVRNDVSGNFTLVAEEKLADGIYRVWAEVIDDRGAKSTPSEEVTISIERPAFLKLGSWAVNLLAVIVPLVAIIFILLFFVWKVWHKFSMFRKKLRKEVHEAESALHKAFNLLKEDIREQIKMFEKTRTKRQLTEEEEKIVKRLSKDLDNAEKFVRKEIEDIKREVK